jgi:hypothetical protein
VDELFPRAMESSPSKVNDETSGLNLNTNNYVTLGLSPSPSTSPSPLHVLEVNPRPPPLSVSIRNRRRERATRTAARELHSLGGGELGFEGAVEADSERVVRTYSQDRISFLSTDIIGLE